MGWIKKAVLSILGLIAILAISFLVFKYYRLSKADKIKIPENSFAVLRVDIDDLMLEMFSNSLSNYSEYYGSRKDTTSGEKKAKIWDIGIHIPAKLYLFSLSDTTYQYYGLVDVTDKDKARNFLVKEFGLAADSSFQSTDLSQQLFSKKHVSALLNDHKLVFTIGPKSQNETLVSLLNSKQENWISANSIGDKINEIEKVDLSYVDRRDNWARVNFSNGMFSIDGYFKSSLFGFSTNPVQSKLSKECVLCLAFNSDLSLLLKGHQSELEKLKLPVDSLDKYVGNFVSIDLKDNLVMESDTIITYDYDDNFVMTEKKEIQQIEVPDLTFQIKASPHLLGYLPEKLFYKFSKDYRDGMISLSTNQKEVDSEAEFVPSDYVFQMSYQKKPSVAKYLGWLPNYDKIKAGNIKGKSEGVNTLKIKGEFTLENFKLHGFYQIFGL